MNYQDWYTDRMDVFRNIPEKDGALTVHKRTMVLENIPCRIYRSSADGPRMRPTAALTESADKVACDNRVGVQAGDELLIRRGAGVKAGDDLLIPHSAGAGHPAIRAFAGDPVYFHEPFGAVMPGLAHQEIGLLQKEFIKK